MVMYANESLVDITTYNRYVNQMATAIGNLGVMETFFFQVIINLKIITNIQLYIDIIFKMLNKISITYYDSAARRIPFFEEVKDMFRYHDLLRVLIINSIKTRYKRSSLGLYFIYLFILLLLFFTFSFYSN